MVGNSLFGFAGKGDVVSERIAEEGITINRNSVTVVVGKTKGVPKKFVALGAIGGKRVDVQAAVAEFDEGNYPLIIILCIQVKGHLFVPKANAGAKMVRAIFYWL